jgi:hypothetical protein
LRLYERVSNEIGQNLHKGLQEREKEIFDEQAAMKDKPADELEMERLQTAKENAQPKKAESVSLNDLFSKYNI